MELQERAVAERQRAEEGEIDMRRLLRQVVELAEDIAELNRIVAKYVLAGKMVDGGGQGVVHHFHAHIRAVVLGRQRHTLQDFQAAPDLADEDAGSVDVEFREDHAAQDVGFQPFPVPGAAVGHGEDGDRARAVGGRIHLGDHRVIIGMIRIVDQPLLALNVVALSAGVIGHGRGARANAEQVGAAMLFRPAQRKYLAFELGSQFVFFSGDQHHIGESAGGAGGHVIGIVAEVAGGFQHRAQQVECGIDIVQHIHHAIAQALVIQNVAELRVFNGVHKFRVACPYFADFSP